jgi:hypothetical protein
MLSGRVTATYDRWWREHAKAIMESDSRARTSSPDPLVGLALGIAVLLVGLVAALGGSGGDNGRETAGAGSTVERRAALQIAGAPPSTATTVPVPAPLDGDGPASVDIIKDPSVPLAAYITANAAAQTCGISNYDAAGDQLDVLVDTSEPYEGIRPVDLGAGQPTSRFQVDCQGPWHIELRDASTLVGVGPGETRQHRGDDVFVVRGAHTLSISGNAGARHLGVQAYDLSNRQAAQLVDTSTPFQADVITPENVLLVVQTDGEWSITNNG